MANKSMTKAMLQAALDEATAKISQLEAELASLRPLLIVVEAQKETIRAQQEALAAYNAQRGQTPAEETPVQLALPLPGDREPLPKKQGTYTVYCDGACIGNGRAGAPGGWAAIVIDPDGVETELSGGIKGTTNNRMELTAAIEGISIVPRGAIVKLIADSQYVLNGLSKGWAKGWRRNGWQKSNGEKALNPDLWDKLLKLAEQHPMSYQWVRGHNGNKYNEQCDRLANGEANKHV